MKQNTSAFRWCKVGCLSTKDCGVCVCGWGERPGEREREREGEGEGGKGRSRRWEEREEGEEGEGGRRREGEEEGEGEGRKGEERGGEGGGWRQNRIKMDLNSFGDDHMDTPKSMSSRSLPRAELGRGCGNEGWTWNNLCGQSGNVAGRIRNNLKRWDCGIESVMCATTDTKTTQANDSNVLFEEMVPFSTNEGFKTQTTESTCW